MGALADEYVRIRADTSYLGRDLRKDGNKSGKDWGESFGGALKKVFAGAAVIGAARVLTGVMKNALMGASDLSETINKSNTIFGKNAKAIENWSKTASRNLGMSQQEALAAASSFGDMFLQLGFAKNKADDMAVSVVQLSADLGSFNNLPTADVSERISAAFRGEYDSLQALVPTINAATVEKQALATTGKKNADSLTAEDKAAAVLKITMDKTKRAHGDFKKTQDGLANSLKTVKARLQDASARFGKLIEPAAKAAIQWFIDKGLPAVEGFVDKLSKDKNLKDSIKRLGDALGGLTDKDFAGTLATLGASLPGVITNIATVVTKLGEFYDIILKFEEDTKPGGPADLGAGPALAADAMDRKVTAAIVRLRGKMVAHIKRMWADVKAAFWSDINDIVTKVSGFDATVTQKMVDMRNKVVAWVKKMWAEIKAWFAMRAAEVSAAVGRFRDRVVTFFTNMRDRVVGIWNRFWASVKSTGSAAMGWLRDRINTVLGQIRTGFSRAVSAIGTAWNRIRDVAAKPIAFVVNTVLEGGLLKAFRAISNVVGYGPGKNFHVGFGIAPTRQGGTAAGLASGGVLPGYTPGKDVHRFYSATGGVLDLSGGEGIARPELVRAIGADRWNAANRAARIGDVDKGVRYLGGFASGGIAAAEKYARSIGINSIGTYPGHHPSQALARDFMTSNRSTGDKMANWLWANRRSLHLWYEIWYRRIRSMTREGAGWQPYTRSNPHTDHVHGSWYPAGLSGAVGALSAAAASLDPSKYLNMVTGALGKLKSIEGTPYGKMIGGIPRKLAGAVKAKITSLAGSFMGAAGSGFTAAGGGSNRAIGKRMMLQRWSAGQWPALNSLWTKESGWRTTAKNPSSGAYGIPQSLPGSKMASAGSDWRTNPATQIKWGLGYIASRYGSPSAAWAHSQRTNWYGMGGVINEPVAGVGLRTGQRYGFGERGPETVTPGRGGRPINIIIDLASGVREVIRGELDEHDEFHASVARMHR